MEELHRKGYKVYGRKGANLFLTIPSVLAQAQGIKAGDMIEWSYIQGVLCIKKA